MLNMYTNAVRYGYLKIEAVPSQYLADVKKALGIEDEPASEEVSA